MTPTNVTYTRRYNVAQYEHEEYTVTAALEKGDSVVSVIGILKADVAAAHAGEGAAAGEIANAIPDAPAPGKKEKKGRKPLSPRPKRKSRKRKKRPKKILPIPKRKSRRKKRSRKRKRKKRKPLPPSRRRLARNSKRSPRPTTARANSTRRFSPGCSPSSPLTGRRPTPPRSSAKTPR